MPIEHRTGSIFDQSDIDIICHQANHWGTLKKRTSSGIASLIEKRYPQAADADVEPYDASKLGTFTYGKGADGKIAINCYSQADRRTCYSSIRTIFESLKERLIDSAEAQAEQICGKPQFKTIGVPYGYGSNIADGKWTAVVGILTSIFEDGPIKLVIVRLPDQADLK